MMFANHQAFGLGVAFVLYKNYGQYIPTTDILIAIPLIMIGILLPDIDSPDSVLGRKIPLISYPVGAFFGHRSITHCLLFCSCLIYYGFTLESVVLFWFGFGALMHILGDYMTPNGVPLLWPLPKRFRFFTTFATGGLIEYLFAWSVFFAGLGYLLNIHLSFLP